MLKNEKISSKVSTDLPSRHSSSKFGRSREDAGGGTNRQRSRIVFKTSNTPSLELVRNLPEQCKIYIYFLI